MASGDVMAATRALGEEGMSLEFRHMASYLILYSSHHLYKDARAADNRMSLTCCFPQEQWIATEQYFKVAL
ncbi:hypothetical protein ACOMHN_046622 [Nucella lapillus]